MLKYNVHCIANNYHSHIKIYFYWVCKSECIHCIQCNQLHCTSQSSACAACRLCRRLCRIDGFRRFWLCFAALLIGFDEIRSRNAKLVQNTVGTLQNRPSGQTIARHHPCGFYGKKFVCWLESLCRCPFSCVVHAYRCVRLVRCRCTTKSPQTIRNRCPARSLSCRRPPAALCTAHWICPRPICRPVSVCRQSCAARRCCFCWQNAIRYSLNAH